MYGDQRQSTSRLFRRLRAVCLIVSVLLLCVQAFASDSLSMQGFVRQVLSANKQLESSRLMEQSATDAQRAVGRWPDPMLMFGLQNAPKDFDLEADPMTMRVIGLSQEVPYSGSRTLQRKAAAVSVVEASAERSAMERDLALAARTAYIDLYYKEQELMLRSEQRDVQQKIVDATTVGLESNRESQSAVLAARNELWRIDASLLRLRQECDGLTYRLNALRGVSPETPLTSLAVPFPESIHSDPAGWVVAADSSYPPLARLMAGSQRLTLESEAASRMEWPMLNVRAEYGIRSGRDVGLHGDPGAEREDMISLGATISLPLFSRGSQRATARSIRAMSASRDAEAEQMRRDLESTLQGLARQLERVDANINLYQNKIIPSAEELTQSLALGYEANRVTLNELLRSQLSVSDERILLLGLLAERSRAVAEVLHYTQAPENETINSVGM